MTSEGYLEIAPLDSSLKNVTDRSAFSTCNHLFGISFYCSFSRGASIYQPELVFEPIDEADPNDIVRRGLIASVPLGPISDFEDFNNRLHNYMAIGGSMGFSDEELLNAVNISTATAVSTLDMRDLMYGVYASVTCTSFI